MIFENHFIEKICLVIMFFVIKRKGIKIEFKGAIKADFHNMISMGYLFCKLVINKITILGIQESRWKQVINAT